MRHGRVEEEIDYSGVCIMSIPRETPMGERRGRQGRGHEDVNPGEEFWMMMLSDD